MSTGSVVREMLESLTVDELRDTLLALRGPEAVVTGRKDALVKQAMQAAALDRVERTAARVEALTPRKHLWLFGVTGSIPTPLVAESRFSLVAGSDEAAFRPIESLKYGSPDLQLRLQLFDRKTGITYLKFDHWVTTETWKRTDARRKELVEVITRHSVTVALRQSQNVMEVRFDGYTQGQIVDEERKLPYRVVAKAAATQSAELLGISLLSISMVAAVERLVDNLPDEVRDIRRSLKTARGGQLEFNAGEDTEADVAAELARFLCEQGGPDADISRDQVRAALRSAPADSVMLLWRKQGLMSRITNHDIGPEVLFIWRNSQRSAASITHVVDSLLRARKAIGTPTTEELLAFIRGTPIGTTIRVSDLLSKTSVDRDSALRSLERATADGLLDRVFRVRTTATLQHFANVWRKSLKDFPRKAVDENGTVIGLDDPSNIEVGYTRKAAL